MFVVDAAILLPHPPHAVARVVERLHVLPRWCAGLRRVRFPAPEPAAAGCVFTYSAVGLRLTLHAHTLAPAAGAAPAVVEHVARGDGLALAWTLAPEPEPAAAGGAATTRLRVRIGVEVDPEHPTGASRAALCRVVARRVPGDLERLRVLLDRYEAGRAAPPAGRGLTRGPIGG